MSDVLTGQLLIAMPQMDDLFFARSVVFMLSHSGEEGAMGLIINKAVDGLTAGKLYAELKVDAVDQPSLQDAVRFGGPVAPGHAFVLHGPEYREAGTVLLGGDFALTTTMDILRATAKGHGPQNALIALGYAGWSPGQLESEIQANGWLSVPADTGIVFEAEDSAKWELAMAKLGVSPDRISTVTGRA